jgi:hypothetical protein
MENLVDGRGADAQLLADLLVAQALLAEVESLVPNLDHSREILRLFE